MRLMEIITGTVGTLGFCILYNLRGKKLLFAVLGGLLSGFVYFTLERWLPDEILRNLIASVTISVYAEVFARLRKTPTTTFLIPAIIPLVPGRAFYYTLNYVLKEHWSAAVDMAVYTLQIALALAVGIIVVASLTRLLTLLAKNHPFHHSI